jgi:hypothetical protein
MRRILHGFRVLLVLLLALTASLLMCVTVVTLTLQNTVFNADYMKQELRERQVYSALVDLAKDSVRASYQGSAYRSTDLDPLVDRLLDAALDAETIRLEMEDVLDQIYSGQQISLNGEYFLEYYSQKIHTALNTLGMKSVQKEQVSWLIRAVADAAREHVDISEYTNKISEAVSLVMISPVLLYLAALVLIAVSFLLILLLSRDRLKALALPFLISGCLMPLASLFLFRCASGLQVVNEPITIFLQSVIARCLLYFLYYAAINLAVGLLLLLVRRIRRKNKRQTAAAPQPGLSGN